MKKKKKDEKKPAPVMTRFDKIVKLEEQLSFIESEISATKEVLKTQKEEWAVKLEQLRREITANPNQEEIPLGGSSIDADGNLDSDDPEDEV
jgi:hypothetical protein